MERWKRTLIAVSGAQLLTGIAYSAYMPSMPFYVQGISDMSTAETTRWMAALSASSAVAMMIASPIWGGLADRLGRKLMMARATLFGALLAFALGLAQTPTQLLIIYMLQGALCGSVSASTTLIATQTPESRMSTALGVMQTVQYAGHGVGPLVGGLVADTLGLGAMFPASGALMSIALLAIMLGVREKFERAPHEAQEQGRRRLRVQLPQRSVVVALFTVGAISTAMALLNPVLSLYVKSLQPEARNISTLAGSAVSVAALSSAIAALLIGRLGDTFGPKRILLTCAVSLALIQIPQALVHAPGQLIALRALEGVFIGGILPTATAVLATSTAAAKRGTIFGLANSLRAGGRAIGPALGAGIANQWGLASAFYGVSGVYALVAGLVAAFVRPQPRAAAPTATQDDAQRPGT